MIRICVIGDIGSGKSYVAKQFGFPIFNADAEVRKIYKKNRKCFKKLKKSMPSFIFYYNLILTLIFLILLFPISLFLSALESIIKKGGCIEVCAILKK